MDRGYDSEAIHRQIREDLHADSIIPIRSWNNEVVRGTYRKEMDLQFDNVRYRRRQLVENKFSVLKRKFSGDLKARKFVMQLKEITGKMIVCNIHRFLQFLVIVVFYRAKFFEQGLVDRLVDSKQGRGGCLNFFVQGPVKKIYAGSAQTHFKQGLLKFF